MKHWVHDSARLVLWQAILAVAASSAWVLWSMLSVPLAPPASAVEPADIVALRQVNERLMTLQAVGPYGLVSAGSAGQVTVLLVGDVMLSRVVAEKMSKYGADYPFVAMAERLRGADIAFGNLETPIVEGRKVSTGDMIFRADPSAASALADAGFDAVSLANNHMTNQGARGFAKTMEFLDAAGVRHSGAGENLSSARQPAIIEREGARFAFLSYSYPPPESSPYDAGEKSYGVAPLSRKMMEEDVAAAREVADFVIVSVHDGEEYAPEPFARQVEFARSAADAGADLVVGHHPHVVQTAEMYRGTPIFYSLGNFVFDQMWSRDTREGLAVEVTFDDGAIAGMELLPVVIEDYAQPRSADEKESERIVARLGEMSEDVRRCSDVFGSVQNSFSENALCLQIP